MAALPIEAHFDRVRANLIRCEECNESFFFDFLRHPRYFVAHFKACHLKNVLYRFNGQSEDENQRVRFGPRRKRDAAAWFGQLKSTEKRMISMQDNKWSEIAEKECWVCRACNDQRADLTHAYELDDLGQRQALLHLRQMHVAAYDAFLRSLPEAPASAEDGAQEAASVASSGVAAAAEAAGVVPIAAALATPLRTTSSSRRVPGQRTIEAERSRLRRLRAPPEARVQEAERSRKRREKMTPAQRHADYERRKRKKKRQEEAERSKQRRSEAPREVREKETLRSRDRRRHASEEQREKEAQRSRERRRKATEEQRARERERCRKRYEAKKQSRSGSTSETSASVPPPASSTPSQPPIEPPRPASSSSAALQSLYASLAEPSRL